MEFFRESMLELITQTSTNLPPDVRAAMGLALEKETPNTQSSQALNIIAENIDMAAPKTKVPSARTPACRPLRSRLPSAPIRS